MNDEPGRGELAAALAKAQAAFPAITRSREVTVQTRTGGSYKFKYAPLDTIFEAIRKPLSDNGLAICQLIDGGDLVTLILHSSGAMLEGRMPLPHNDGDTVQQLGSAITYFRRYALQAALGIAAEEDDDGNAASGNRATAASATERAGFAPREPAPDPFNAGLIGFAEKGKNDADFELRPEAKVGHVLLFRLSESAGGKNGWKVIARGPLAEMLAEHRKDIEGQRVTCWGSFEDDSYTKPDGFVVKYKRLALTRLKVGMLDLSAPDVEPDESQDEDFEAGFLKEPEAVPA